MLVWKFSREKLHNATYKHQLKKLGVRAESIKEPVSEGPAGDLMEGMNAFYSANLSQEVRRGQRHVAERGYYPGHRAPYGYCIEKVREESGNAYHNVFVIERDTALSSGASLTKPSRAGRSATSERG